MLNSSGRLIGSEIFFILIDWQSGGTGKQNISQQAFAPTAMPSKVVAYLWIMSFVTVAKERHKSAETPCDPS